MNETDKANFRSKLKELEEGEFLNVKLVDGECRDADTNQPVLLNKEDAKLAENQLKYAKQVLVITAANPNNLQLLSNKCYELICRIASELTWNDVPMYWRKFAKQCKTDERYRDIEALVDRWSEHERESNRPANKEEADDGAVQSVPDDFDEWYAEHESEF